MRSLLQLALLVAVIWFAARVLRTLLLGRVGELGKLLLIGALVGVYALTVLATAMGMPLPWMPFIWVALGLRSTVIIVVASAIVVWLVLREIPFTMPYWAGFMLEGPLRALLMPADVTLNQMALAPGMRVVEVGCGTGHLSTHVARRIQPGGTLFCVDIQQQMVEKTLKRVEAQGATQRAGLYRPGR